MLTDNFPAGRIGFCRAGEAGKEGNGVTLNEATQGQEYIIREILTDDEALNAFLFSLGCYSGEAITVVSHLKSGVIVSIKDSRYNIDRALAAAILV